MLREPLDEGYFNWLCAKVGMFDSTNNYRDLLRILHSTEFVWLVIGDKNRAEDGVELREDFFRERFCAVDHEWMSQPCSVFEVLVGFAKRAAFQSDGTIPNWFYAFLINLGLDDFRRVDEQDIPFIDEIVGMFIWRTYKANGEGGLFPIRNPRHDQREVEIWYQFCEYVEEQGII